MIKEIYESPQVEVIEVEVERGFAGSGNETIEEYQDGEFSW